MSAKVGRWARYAGAAIICCAVSLGLAFADTANNATAPLWGKPGDPGVITTLQRTTPVGVQAVFQGRVYGVTFGRTASEVIVLTSGFLHSGVSRLSVPKNQTIESVQFGHNASAGLPSIQYDAATGKTYVGMLAGDFVQIDAVAGHAYKAIDGRTGRNEVGAIALAARDNNSGQRILAVPLTYNNQLALLDTKTGKLVGKAPTEIAPFAVALNSAGSVAYVSNLGGRFPNQGDRTRTAGSMLGSDRTDKPGPDHVVVDNYGIASSGTVTRIDLSTMKTTDSIAVGLHPTAIAWDEGHDRLYVANSNSDSISVIDTSKQNVIQTIDIRPFLQRLPGLAPTALVLNSDGTRLYAACSGINAIAVFDLPSYALRGMIPTPWYPDSLALSAGGNHLAVGALLGVGSGSLSATDSEREFQMHGPHQRYVHAYRGTVNVIKVPDDAQLAQLTAAVAENNHMRLASLGADGSKTAPRPNVKPVAVPAQAGEPSLIDHVVFVIKENRTYDQYFGDMHKGNGDPKLSMYGPAVTPNHHRLADQFVLLDNFYATGGNSGDGHQWVTQANETEYTMFPGYGGRSYPFGGDDPLAVSSGGFIWDDVLRAHKTVNIFGEYVGYGYAADMTSKQADLAEKTGKPTGPELIKKVAQWRRGVDFSNRWHNVAPNPVMDPIMAHDYPAWGEEEIPDVIRAQVFISHLKGWQRSGSMPNFVLMHLPSDHTEGETPGYPTPKASIADNDQALGNIVDALSHSRFWKHMAIFVVEDDAQGALDHVDGHRTVALAISPYIRRGSVDSTPYAQQSMVKTIELMLGLPPMTIFDLTASDMRASFQNTADYTPYKAVTPTQSLTELVPPLKALTGPRQMAAIASMKMRFDVVDAAPSEELNQILWHDARGWNTPYPKSHSSVFTPTY